MRPGIWQSWGQALPVVLIAGVFALVWFLLGMWVCGLGLGEPLPPVSAAQLATEAVLCVPALDRATYAQAEIIRLIEEAEPNGSPSWLIAQRGGA